MPVRTWMHRRIFFSEGKTIDQFPVEKFILSAHVVPIENATLIAARELEKVKVRSGEAILFKTQNSTTGRIENGIFQEDFVYLSLEGADWCVRKRVGLVGIDYISIEKYGSTASSVHGKSLETTF